MKKIVSLILIFALSVSIIACTKEDISLYDAFENMKDVGSIETNTDMTFTLSGKDLGDSDTMMINRIVAFINEMKLKSNVKSLTNEDKTVSKSESEVNIELMGTETLLKSWMEMNTETSEMKTITKIPKMLLASINMNSIMGQTQNPLAGKEYIIYDMGKMMQGENTEVEKAEVDYKAMMEFQKEIQPKIIKFMEDIEEDLELENDIIKLQEEKEVDGEKIKIYRVKLNDKSLREVLKDTVDYLIENDATKKFMIEYFDAMKNMAITSELNDQELQELEEDIADIEENLDENLEKIRQEFNLFMEKMEEINILGEEGIEVFYTINEDGYITEADGVMDFNIDLDKINKLTENPQPGMKGNINFKVNYTTRNTNINSKDIKVNMPELNPENSIEMQELIEN